LNTSPPRNSLVSWLTGNAVSTARNASIRTAKSKYLSMRAVDVCLLAPINEHPCSPELFHNLPAGYESTQRPSPPSIHAAIQHAPRYWNQLLPPQRAAHFKHLYRKRLDIYLSSFRPRLWAVSDKVLVFRGRREGLKVSRQRPAERVDSCQNSKNAGTNMCGGRCMYSGQMNKDSGIR
jgi:hypothetical protein